MKEVIELSKKRYTLENINEIEIEHKDVIKVSDSSTGEEKEIKTVSRAEVATVFAYMLGVGDDVLDRYYSHHYSAVLERLRKDQAATIVRYLCEIRTTLMNHFLDIDNDMRYNLSNLDRMQYFDKKKINALQGWGIGVIKTNYRSDKYVVHLTRLLDENIDACEKWFPDSVKFDYVRDAFVPPKYEKPVTMKDEYDKYRAKKMFYPFQLYMYWDPSDQGNLLYSDAKLLHALYAVHGQEFVEAYKYRDASDNTKEAIYQFIRDSKKVVMAVDCENADPYKLYGVLKNLDAVDRRLIDRIILYDDYHTTIAWDYIGSLIDVPVEHVEVPRVTDAKSLVDIQMAVGVSASHYRDEVDSFILCSSDSDFWGLISSIPEARFLVLYEYSKCGNAVKEAWSQRNIFHCAMDDFYMENAKQLQDIVLKKVLDSYLPGIVGENGWEVTRRVFADAFIQADEKEMLRFYEKYIKRLRLKIGNDGVFYVMLEE